MPKVSITPFSESAHKVKGAYWATAIRRCVGEAGRGASLSTVPHRYRVKADAFLRQSEWNRGYAVSFLETAFVFYRVCFYLKRSIYETLENRHSGSAGQRPCNHEQA